MMADPTHINIIIFSMKLNIFAVLKNKKNPKYIL
jgi:hypothetical protein